MIKSLSTGADLNEYIAHEKYRMTFWLMFMITIFLMLLDYGQGHKILHLSTAIIIELQKLEAYKISIYSGYIIYGLIYLYIVLAFMLRKNQESNFSLVFGTFILMYTAAVSRLILVGHRPFFISNELKSDHCICDYGKPSANAVIGIGNLMLIYTDIVHHHNITKGTSIIMKVAILVIQVYISFTRLYIGAHSLNQIIIGWSIGVTTFLGIRLVNDYMLKFIIWPIFYKDRFTNKKAIFHLLFHMMWTNYLVFFLWSYRYTLFDVANNPYFNFANCKICLNNIQQNFSVKVVKEALWFNLFFGMMIGIYISRKVRFTYVGFYDDRYIGKCILRILVFLLCTSPLVFAIVPVVDSVVISFVRILLLSLFVGIIITSFYYRILDFLGLSVQALSKSGLCFVSPFDTSIIID